MIWHKSLLISWPMTTSDSRRFWVFAEDGVQRLNTEKAKTTMQTVHMLFNSDWKINCFSSSLIRQKRQQFYKTLTFKYNTNSFEILSFWASEKLWSFAMKRQDMWGGCGCTTSSTGDKKYSEYCHRGQEKQNDVLQILSERSRSLSERQRL